MIAVVPQVDLATGGSDKHQESERTRIREATSPKKGELRFAWGLAKRAEPHRWLRAVVALGRRIDPVKEQPGKKPQKSAGLFSFQSTFTLFHPVDLLTCSLKMFWYFWSPRGPVSVSEFAEIIDEKPIAVIKFLMTDLGVMASMTQSLDPATCIAVAEGFGKIIGDDDDYDDDDDDDDE
jgi:hypothetical protein